MTANAFWHLAWKEYRVNRAYWLSLVVLVMIADVSTAMMSPRVPTALNAMILGLSLAAPALFAVGSAGMAFAMEREEGTLEFLRGVAASPKQLLASKLFVTFVGTAALYALLLPIAFYFSAGELPKSETTAQMLDLWLVAALEAIAWGTFFSLLGSRPLLAICEGIFVTAFFAFLAVVASEYSPPGQYTASAPWRVVIALTVLAIDVYLADSWPERESGESWLRTIRRQNAHLIDADASNISLRDSAAIFVRNSIAPPIARIARRFLGRDCSMSLGRLLWQQWRQSARTMALLGAMYIAAIVVDRLSDRLMIDWRFFFSFLLPFAAALVGCFVFRADQRQHGYRFFAEQNVRPTYMWISRVVPWLTMFLILEIGRCFSFARNGEPVAAVIYEIPWMILLPLAAFSFGQWISMFVRSPIVAMALAAAGSIALCFWFDLFGPMWILHTWVAIMFFGPIAVMYIAATWLRSRDWILENRTWRARARAVLVVLIPGIAIFAAHVLHRAYQIPLVSPGFDIATIDRPITEESAKTEKLYRLAGLRFVERANVVYDDRHTVDYGGIGRDNAWIATNAEALNMAIEASSRPIGKLYDPETADSPQPPNISGLAELVFTSGNQLLDQGKLDMALDRYFAALHIACEFDVTGDPNAPGNQRGVAITKPWQFPGWPPYPAAVPIASYFSAFPRWAAQKGQTPATIDAAIDRLRQIDPTILRLRQKIEWHYAFARRRLLDGERPIFPVANFQYVQNQYGNPASDWLPLLPWDRERALRMLNLLTATSLDRLQAMHDALANRSEIATYLPTNLGLVGFFRIDSSERSVEQVFDPKAFEEMFWLEGTRPSELSQAVNYGFSKAIELADFETARCGTMLQLAIQSYRLKHGSLPKSLADLVGPSFRELPSDPYTGKDFRYYPAGIPEQMKNEFGQQERDLLQADAGAPIGVRGAGSGNWKERDLSQADAGAPGVWSEGAEQNNSAGFAYENYWQLREQPLLAATWYRGIWFPIPEQKK